MKRRTFPSSVNALASQQRDTCTRQMVFTDAHLATTGYSTVYNKGKELKESENGRESRLVIRSSDVSRGKKGICVVEIYVDNDYIVLSNLLLTRQSRQSVFGLYVLQAKWSRHFAKMPYGVHLYIPRHILASRKGKNYSSER